MGINAKQARFLYKISKLVILMKEEYGQEFIGAELFRTPEQAAINAKKGVGIKNSIHRKKMALDMFRLVDGKISWKVEDYKQAGECWKMMDPDARWGGDFLSRRDAVHFSFIHNGVM